MGEDFACTSATNRRLPWPPHTGHQAAAAGGGGGGVSGVVRPGGEQGGLAQEGDPSQHPPGLPAAQVSGSLNCVCAEGRVGSGCMGLPAGNTCQAYQQHK